MAPSFWGDLRYKVILIGLCFIYNLALTLALSYFCYSDLAIYLYRILALIFVWVGFFLFLYGAILNILVKTFNGGLMPILIDYRKLTPEEAGSHLVNIHFSGKHCLLVPETRLKFLADRINLQYGGRSRILSIGDMFLDFGNLINDWGIKLAWLSLVSSFALWILFKI